MASLFNRLKPENNRIILDNANVFRNIANQFRREETDQEKTSALSVFQKFADRTDQRKPRTTNMFSGIAERGRAGEETKPTRLQDIAKRFGPERFAPKKEIPSLNVSQGLAQDAREQRSERTGKYPKTERFFEDIVTDFENVASGAGKFAAQTSVRFIDLVSEGADFTANFTVNQLLDEKGILGGIKNREKWKDFYAEQLEAGNIPTRKFKLAVDKLEEKEFMQPSKEWENASLKEKLTTKIGETILNIGPSIVSSIGAFALNPTFGVSTIITSTANDVTEDAIDNNVPRDKAELLGLSTGIAVGLLERIVPSRIFSSQGIKNKFIGSFAKRLANSAVTETGTEIAQENIQLIAESTFREDLGFDEVATRNALAGLGGLLGGAGMQTIATFSNETQRKEILGALKDIPFGLSTQDVNKRIAELEAKEKLTTKQEKELTKLKQLSGRTAISPEPLAQARKAVAEGKTVDEFVKAQPKVFHGTPDVNIQTLKPSKTGDLGEGIYLTRNRQTAENFSDMTFRDSSLEARGDGSFININTGEVVRPPKPGIVEAVISDLKIKQLAPGEYSAEINKLRQPDGRLPQNYETLAQNKFKKQGFDGIELKGTPRGENDQILIFPKSANKLKTKSQLTKIFNEAKGAVRDGIPGRRGLAKVGLAPEAPAKITKQEDILLKGQIRAEARTAKKVATEVKRTDYQALKRFGAVQSRVKKAEVKSEKERGKVKVAETKAIEREKAKQTVSEIRKNKAQELKDYKENLKNRQQEALELIDKLPSELQGRMKQAIAQSTTTTRVFRLRERVKRRIEEYMKRQGIAEAGGLIRTAKTAKITPKYQRLIADLTKGYDFKKPTDKTVKRLKATREFLEQNPDYPIPEKYIEEIRRLEKTNLRDLDVGGLKRFNDTIRNLVRIGEEIQKHRAIVNSLKFQNEINRAFMSTNNLDSGNEDLNRAYEAENAMEFTFRVADKTDGSQFYKGWHAEFVKEMGRSVNEAEIEQSNRVFNFLQKHAEVTNFTLDEKQQKEVAAHLYNDQGGKEQTAKILKDLGLDSLPELSEEQVKVRDLLVETAKQKTEKIQPLWETTMVDDKGRPMAFEVQDRYFPFFYEEQGSDLGVYSILQDYRVQSKIKFGSGFARQAGVELTPRTDIYKMLQEAVAKQELFLNLQPQLFEKGTIFRTKEYQAKAGKINSKYWAGYVDEMSRNGMSSNAIRTPMDWFLRKGRQNIARGLLDLSFTSTAIQPFAIFDAMGYMTTYMPKSTVFKLIGNFVQSFVRPNFARNTIEQSKALTTRRGGEEVIQSFDQGKTKKGRILTENVWQQMVRTVTSPFAALRFFDIRTATSVQKTAVTELAKTMPMESAQAEADFIMDLLSGSSNLAYRPRIMNQGELGRAITTFQTFVLNEWGLITQDMIKKGVVNGGPNRNVQTRLWALIGIMFFFLQGYLEDLVRSKITNAVKGTEYESKSFLKSSLLYIPERVPVIGNVVGGVEYGRTGLPVAVFDIFTDTIEGTYGAITAKETKTKLKNLTKTVEAVAILFFGIPGSKEAQNIIERAIEESDIGEESVESIREEILERMEAGEISVDAAKGILQDKLKKLQKSDKKKVFELSIDDYRNNLADRIESGEISVDEAKEELTKYLDENKEKIFDSPDEDSFIDKVILWGKAFKTDPITFTRFMFAGETIKKVRGDAIIVERIPLEESEEIKKERGAKGDMKGDHTIPLGMGGDNSKGNLKLVTNEEWERYTPIEMFLIMALEKGVVERKEAQRLIVDFKEGKITDDEVYQSVKTSD